MIRFWLTKWAVPNCEQEDHGHMGNVSPLFKKRRRLLRERQDVTAEVRSLLGFKNFMELIPFRITQRSVLKELHEQIGQPVINRLQELGIPKHSRILWYATSVFCSLPYMPWGQFHRQAIMISTSQTYTFAHTRQHLAPSSMPADWPSNLSLDTGYFLYAHPPNLQ